MSIPAPGYIWRIIEAVSRPIDQPIGPIHLDTADADWLRDHLLELAAAIPPRKGRPSALMDCAVWIALDVALRIQHQPLAPKQAHHAVATDWGLPDDGGDRHVEEMERAARSEAEKFLHQIDHVRLAALVKTNRSNFLSRKST
jgi:hypothetical protein